MKKISTALAAIAVGLAATIPFVASSAEGGDESTYTIDSASSGFYIGGTAGPGTNTPRTWRNLQGVTISLNSATTQGLQQLSTGDGNAFLLHGVATVALPSGITLNSVEVTFEGHGGATPTLTIPAESTNSATAGGSAISKTLAYTWSEPVSSFDIKVTGTKAALIKSIKLNTNGDIADAGYITTNNDYSFAHATNDGTYSGLSNNRVSWWKSKQGGINITDGQNHIGWYTRINEKPLGLMAGTYTISAESGNVTAITINAGPFSGNPTIKLGDNTPTELGTTEANKTTITAKGKGPTMTLVVAGGEALIWGWNVTVTTKTLAPTSGGNQGGSQSADITIDASEGTGTFSGTGSFHATWTSNRTNPQFTLNAGGGSNNMQYSNGHIACFVGKTEAGKTYTFAAGDAHYVSHVRLVARRASDDSNITITMGGKTITVNASEQTLEADFAEGTPATMKLDGANKGAELVVCEITATPNGQQPGQSVGGGSTSNGSTIIMTPANCDAVEPNTTGTWVRGFASQSNPQVTFKCDNGEANMSGSTTDYFDVRNGKNATSRGFTVSVPEGNVINSVSFDYSSPESSTITAGGKTYNGSSTSQKVTITGSGNSVSFTLASGNKETRLSNFTVVVNGGAGSGNQGGTASGELLINNAGAGTFTGGTADKGTPAPRTWNGTVSGTTVTITLEGATQNAAGVQRFAADGQAFLMCGQFTLTLPEGMTVSAAEFTMTSTEQGTPALVLPSGSQNIGTTTSDGAEMRHSYSWDTPVNSFRFDTQGSKKALNVKSIKLTVNGGGSSTVTPEPTPVTPAPTEPITEETTFAIERSQCEPTATNPAGTFAAGFASTNTNPVVTISGNGKNNADARATDYFLLHSGGSSLNWSISVPTGFLITGVSMDYRMHGSQASTIDFNGSSYTGTATDQTLSVTGLTLPAFSFTINESNGGVEIRNLKVTVAPDPNSAEQEIPETPEKPTTVGGGDPVAFEVSPAPKDGQFDPDTKWYVMTLAAGEFALPYTEGADRIRLSQKSAKEASQQYCIVGDDTDGYTIYNKAAGPEMMLAAPTEMKGTTGMDSYAILKAPGDAGYFYTWDFQSSGNLSGKTGYYIGQHGNASNYMNNRGSILAFWTGGKDSGSTFLFYPPENIPQTPEYLQAPAIFPVTGEAPYNVCYRIPAIAVVGGGEHAGRIIAFSDYRKHGSSDISTSSNIDQHYTYSDDGGTMWKHPDWMRDANGKPVSLARNGISLIDPSDHRDNSFSDPCVAADRESGRIIVMSPAGTAGFFGGRYPENPTEVARWFSYDGGDTWTDADYDVTRQIHAVELKDAYNGDGVDGMFWGSGKIHQSRYVKVGDFYRLYHAISTQNNGGNKRNYVFYSDDFGENWHLLGHDPEAPAASTNSPDEPKVEELPDGSILLAARSGNGNRNWNIFTFTDVEKGEGSWGTVVNRNILGQNINACNGEILFVRAIDNASGDECWLMLQSIPFSSSRENVSICYKRLRDYSTPAAVGENFEGRYQVSWKNSTYSTMAEMLDGNIAFIYEEETWGYVYTEMFRKLAISEITRGRYRSIQEEANPDDAFNAIKANLDPYLAMTSSHVGDMTPSFLGNVQALIREYYQTRSGETLSKIDALINGEREVIAIADNASCKISNVTRTPGTERFLVVKDNNLNVTTNEAEAHNFRFIASDPANRSADAITEFMIQNVETGRYLGPTGGVEERLATVETLDDAGVYTYAVDVNGNSSLTCLNPGGAHNSLHLGANDGNTKVVPWTADSEASKWYIAPEDPEAAVVLGIGKVEADGAIEAGTDAPERLFDIYGREVAAPVKGNLYITSKGRKFIAR